MTPGRLAALVIPVLWCTGCVRHLVRVDELCPAIVTFANATPSGEKHAVELTTDWGAVYTEDRDSLWAKECEHGGYAPGSALCEYLMENTVVEFSAYNYRRALECLAPEVGFEGVTALDRQDSAMTAYDMTRVDPGVTVTAEYANSRENAPPVLRISAERRAAR